MSGRLIARAMLCALLLLSCSYFLRAQSTYGALTGTVTDSSGAAVVGATVTLTNKATSEKEVQSTGETGLYSFVNLNPGDYRLVVEKAGFKRVDRSNVSIQVQQTSRIDFSMTVGQVSETVTVTAETPLLQSETSSLGQVVEERNADELPLNGRNVFSLVEVAPSVVMQGQAGATATGQNPFSWGNFQIGGAFANQSAEYLDGQPLNIGYINLPILIPTQDSIGEFKVQTNNIGPEWGKVAGGVLNLSTKSGSNNYHGEAYEYIRNKVLNANDWFSDNGGLAKPPFTQNQFGVNFGGRVIRDKTFFFYSYEGFRLRSGSPWQSTVPTAQETGGGAGGGYDLSAFAAASGVAQIYDPCGGVLQTVPNPDGLGVGGCGTLAGGPNPTPTATPFAGNIIPASRVNATAKALLDLWPKPTNSAVVNNYVASYALGGNQNQNLFRVDQKINDAQHIFGRFSQWNNLNLPEDPLGTGLCLDRCTETMTSKTIAIGYNYVINPNVIANLDVSASRFNYLRTPKNSGFDFTTIGWPTAYNSELPSSLRTPPTPDVLGMSDSVMSTQGQSYIVDHDTQYWISPTITLVHGRNTIQAGFQDEITLDNYAQSNIVSGSLGFSGSYTKLPFADFLLGYAQNPSNVGNHFFGDAVIPNLVAGKQFLLAGFVNDTYHATTKLTLNLGLRYDYQSPWTERFNRQSYFDPSAVDPIQALYVGSAGGPSSNVLGAVGLVATPGIHESRYNIDPNKLGVAPRLGFAYSWDAKTVIRGGYGLFWSPIDANWATNPLNDPVNSIQTDYVGNNGNPSVPTNTIETPWINFVQPPGRSQSGKQGISLAAVDLEGTANPTFDTPSYQYSYTQQWNFDVQRTLWGGWFADVAYAANKGTHLPQYSQQIDQIGDNYLAQAHAQYLAAIPGCVAAAVPLECAVGSAAIAQQVTNPFSKGAAAGSAMSAATTSVGQLLRPFPQYAGLQYAGQGSFSSIYHSLQATLQKRFNGGGTVLAAYTWSKLLSNTDTITSWLETGGTGGIQDWNNLRGEKSLSSQNVPQHLIVSYVLDLPFGSKQKYANSLPPLADKVVGGWGVDGVTTFQDGFPINISANNISGANYYGGGLRPNVVPGCDKATHGSADQRVKNGLAGGDGWINSACFSVPDPYQFGNEPRVDASLKAQGIDNWDFAAFKHTTFGPDQKLGFEFRCEIFNTFNHVQFGPPANGFGGVSSFGQITAQVNNPRLVQFAGKIIF